MNFLYAGILSIIEGITEFLPISSTGHLILAAQLLRIPQTEFVKTFEIAIQLGAITAVVFLYWKTLLSSLDLWKRVLVAFFPSAFLGFVLYRSIKQLLIGNVSVTLAALSIGGILLIVLEQRMWSLPAKAGAPSVTPVGRNLFEPEPQSRRPERGATAKAVAQVEGLNTRTRSNILAQLTFKQSLIIGLCQSVSMIPGVSRAAATIIGGLIVGLPRKEAVMFSFLLAVPTMAAATGLDLVKTGFSFSTQEYVTLGIGGIGACLTAAVAIRWLLQFTENHTLSVFGVYRILLAALFALFIR